MKAFVQNSVSVRNGIVRHYLWLCDLTCEAVFFTSKYDLPKGHFFEGVFVLKETRQKIKQWTCMNYVEEIPPLLEGSLDNGRIELVGEVISYQRNGEKYPECSIKYIGTVVDNKIRLPSNCIGMKVTIEQSKLDGEWQWVVKGFP